jgi:hypothetical protein
MLGGLSSKHIPVGKGMKPKKKKSFASAFKKVK